MPTVPGPEELEEESTVALRFLTDPKYNLSEATKIFIEFADRKIDSFTDKRPVDPELYLTIKKQTKPNKLFCWIRPKHTIPNTSVNAKAFLSYVSDYGTVESALKPHTSKNGYIASFTTSLNHVIYFHHSDFDVNDWLLYETDTPNAFAGRAIIFCRFWTRDGRLVATVIQECLIRAKTISKI
uniref:Acyl_CoA_thio domain-containing protein n=1 Tax=Rhabditophanes sp. KR3021 TaxID=114890 RepID=A0AC35U321_9BILA